MSEFKKYKDSKRDASQSEVSSLNISQEAISFSGYQKYYITLADKKVHAKTGKLRTYFNLCANIDFFGLTVADIGCSNGGFGLWTILQKKCNKAYLVDHDKECIDNISKALDVLNLNATPVYTTFHDYSFISDVAVSLSTIHWLYSATEGYGSLFPIAEKFRSLCTKFLIVEWVDPSDSAIQYLGHVFMNKEIHKSEYSKDNFLKAFGQNFSKVSKLGNSRPSREVYLCSV